MSLIERAIEKIRATSGGAEPARPTRRETTHPAGKSAGTASRVAAAPQLTITPESLAAAGFRAPTEFLHQQTAEYRHIKRQLIAGMREVKNGHARLIVVTSALAQDGKTHSAVNLALSLAMEPDYSVLLVDADVIKPNLSRSFGVQARPGLMEAVSNPEIQPESLVLSTNVEGFSILPAGRRDENATEYFASARMVEVINQLMTPANRIVVVDTLPLLLTTESRALLPLAGHVVMVVRADVTPTEAVRSAVELIGESTNVSLLLNGVEVDAIGNRLYRNYSYKYSNTGD
jgi:protein-tyrosine kinase